MSEVKTLQHYPRCFGCGVGNESGLQLAVTWDGHSAFAEHLTPQWSEGGPGIVHGGYIGALVDEVMALVAAESTGLPAMTRRLEIEFLSPIPTTAPLNLKAWVADGKRRHLTVELVAKVGNDGITCVRAIGIFVVVPPEKWIRYLQAQGRGPESVDWSGGDPSTFLQWQMRVGLEAVFHPDRLARSISIRLQVADVHPPIWSIIAGPRGITVHLGSPSDPDLPDACFEGKFREWQELIHGTASLDLLISRGVRVDGQAGALMEFVHAIDFRSPRGS